MNKIVCNGYKATEDTYKRTYVLINIGGIQL